MVDKQRYNGSLAQVGPRMHDQIPEKHIAKAHVRMPSTGKTRFHASIDEIYSSDRIHWLDVPACPLNRRARDGQHPLVSATVRLVRDMKEHVSDLGEMPTWWNEVYKNDTKEDWIRRKTERDERVLGESWKVFDHCLDHVDWKDWKSDDVGAILKVTPVSTHEDDDRNGILERLLERGLPIDRLRHQGYPVTPAMWHLINAPYSYCIEGWLELDLPLDPPGKKHPGLISSILFSWNRLPEAIKSNIDHILARAFSKGAQIDRPLAPQAWVDNQTEKKDSLLFKSAYDHCSRPTIFGQAQALKNPGLIAALGNCAQATDEDRIDSVQTLMRQTSEMWGRGGHKEKNEGGRIEHFNQLEKLLVDHPRDRRKWKEAGHGLLMEYFQSLWPHVSALHEPRVLTVLDRLEALGVDLNDPLADAPWASMVNTMGWTMSLPEANVALDVENGALGRVKGIDLPFVANSLAIGAARRCFSERYTQVDKFVGLLKTAISMAPLSESAFQGIEETIFNYPKNSIGLIYVQAITSMLEDNGWKTTSNAWATLSERLLTQGNYDNPDIICYLADVAARGAPPKTMDIFRAPRDPKQNAQQQQAQSYCEGYSDVCDWTLDAALSAHLHVAKRAIGMIDVNSTAWARSGVSALQVVANLMAQKPGQVIVDHLDKVAEMLWCAGADPAQEKHPTTGEPGGEWVEDVDWQHSFYPTLSRWSQVALDQATPQATHRPKNRRI